MNIRAPQIIVTDSGNKWLLKEYCRDYRQSPLVYTTEDINCGMMIPQHKVELEFTREGRPEPKSSVITQGKYECAAASLAMLLGENLFNTKRAMGRFGWCNDDRGAGNKVMTEAARFLGRDLIEVVGKEITASIGPCSLTLPSLNVKGMYHAITWNGEEILDPNYGRSDRKFWGPEWGPETIGARRALVLLDKNLTNGERAEYDEAVRSRDEKEINAIKDAVFAALNKDAS